jgi:bleomycin hydrolase
MKLQSFFIVIVFGVISHHVFGQAYQFEDVIKIDALPVISQDKTGTCWSYSTTSFLESEIIKKTGKRIDLSEMYPVKNNYNLKAENYILRQGKAQFDEGALAHDILNSMEKYGLMPVDAYSGLEGGMTTHNHAEMVEVMKSVLDAYLKNPNKKLSNKWRTVIPFILDAYLGAAPNEFQYNGVKYTPKSFKDMTTLSKDDYTTLTSFTHVPFYTSTILSIPDNFSNGSMYNVPMTTMTDAVDHALKNGYTVALDCDVSEPTFSAKYGVAVIPANAQDNEMILKEIKPEQTITQAMRQEGFEALTTTDDHLMHIVGTVKDQKGNTYYKVKNSWGSNPEKVANQGYIYMSKPYFQLKTISVLLNKNALSDDLKSKVK